jgi:CheY-like chemotaxis protein
MARTRSAQQRVPLADGLAAVFAAELDEQLHAALAAWPRASASGTRPDAFRELARIFHTIKGGAGLVGRGELATAALTLERFFADPDAASAPEQTVVDAVFGAASLPPPALASLLQALLAGEAGLASSLPAAVVPVSVGDVWMALPLAAVERAVSINTPEASLTIVVGERELAALRLADLIGAPPPPPRAVALVLRGGGALVVDRVRPPVSLVVEPLGRLLALHPWLAGAAVDPRGRALGVLDAERLLHAFSAISDDAEPGDGTRRVLVVDDSLVAREAAAAALRDAGVTFDVARDGREALVKLERCHYAVVLSDLEMPHLDGFGLVERLRASARLREQPVVVCSSRLDEDARQRLSPFGVDGYVDKPFVAGELLAALRPWLAASA